MMIAQEKTPSSLTRLGLLQSLPRLRLFWLGGHLHTPVRSFES